MKISVLFTVGVYKQTYGYMHPHVYSDPFCWYKIDKMISRLFEIENCN